MISAIHPRQAAEERERLEERPEVMSSALAQLWLS